MIDAFAETVAVRRHPSVLALGETPGEQHRAEVFAHDLAAWLAGAETRALRPLGRVVVAVSGRSLSDTRSLCEGLPLLSVEAAARMAAALWPLVRWADPAAPDEGSTVSDRPEGEEGSEGGESEGQGEGGDAGTEEAGEAGAGSPGDEGAEGGGAGAEGADPAHGSDTGAAPPTPEEVAQRALEGAKRTLSQLGEADDAPELDALAMALSKRSDDVAGELTQAAKQASAQAWEGAKEGEQLARVIDRLAPGLGWGSNPGALQRALLKKLEPFVLLLERLPELRELADALGRVEDEDRRQRQRPGGGEEVTGVMLGGDVARALPSELALLADPDLEDLFLLRWQERRLLSLELTGQATDGVAGAGRKGPVIAAVDTSGSMRGPPGVMAKAVLLAVVRRVVPQGRAVHVLLFGSLGESTELRFRRGAGGLEDLLAFLALSFDGGTDFDTPLQRALVLLEERDLQDADLLVITDGYARATPEIEAAVKQARLGRGARCFGVVVPGGTDDGLVGFADPIWRLDGDPASVVALVRQVGAIEGGWRGSF